ncbi:MAG: MraY family glycosyltransferase [Candidatus Levybacteria bacterium]|nr:MraY family glycosyltransferase [Candidatus Levybacteria bacterium]
MQQLLFAPLIAFFATVITVPLVIRFAKRAKLMDDPKTHIHPAVIHKKPIPRAGGLAIFLGILISALVFVPFDNFTKTIFLGGLVVVVTGVLDDKYDLSPYIRFGVNILTAMIAVYAGVTIPFITNPLGGILHFNDFQVIIFSQAYNIGDALAVVWIVWVMNMLNWSKGVDGQMPGIAAISAFVIGIAAFRFMSVEETSYSTSLISFIVGGASLGFLVYNFYPAKIFPGYSATILGYFIGILSITSGVKLATAVLVMGVPSVDAAITIFRRILSKKSPFWHDRGHLHHLLLNYGLGHRSIAVFYWLMSLILGFVALMASSRGKLFVIMLVVVVVLGFVFMLRVAGKHQDYD